MREYGISYDEGSGLPVGSYILHRRDGASMPTVFGSFAKGVCGPIKGTPASRLCMAIGHELSRVERLDEATGEAAEVWPNITADAIHDGDPAVGAEIEPGADLSGAVLTEIDEATGEAAEVDEGESPEAASVTDDSAAKPKRGRKKSREA